jgi:hypothetical protein
MPPCNSSSSSIKLADWAFKVIGTYALRDACNRVYEIYMIERRLKKRAEDWSSEDC